MLTPAEVKRETQARTIGKRVEIAFLAYETAYLQRVEAKNFPELADYLRRLRGEPKRQQTAEEQQAILRQWEQHFNRKNAWPAPPPSATSTSS
jgi:N-acyl-D-aspartate/D-glutamate deacylase